MNTDSMHKVVQLDEKELRELIMEVKETVAHKAVFSKKSTKRFTAAQMWNVKRRMRSASLAVPQIRVVD